MKRVVGILLVFLFVGLVAAASPQIASRIVRDQQDVKTAAVIIVIIAGCIGLPVAYLIYDRRPDYYTFNR